MVNQKVMDQHDAPSAADGCGVCLLCGQNQGATVWREHGYDCKFCDACGVAYLDPSPPPGRVDATWEKHDDSYYAKAAHLRARWLSGVRSSGRLLEVGCGPGHFLLACQRLGYEVHGCEADPQRADLCRSKLGIPVETALIEDSKLADESFDIVYHVDLLSHFPDPLLALSAMRRLLRPAGLLCFEVGTLAGISSRWYRWNGGLGCPDHRWFYTFDGVRRLLERAGLQIVESKQFGLVPSMLPLVLGRTFIKPVVQLMHRGERPWEGSAPAEAGQLRKVTGVYRLGCWLDHHLRYGVGRFAPAFGPATFFIAAAPLPPLTR